MATPIDAIGGDPSVLRRINLHAVLRVLHSGGVHTITGLTELAHLSRPTTKQAIDDLVAAGWAVPIEPPDGPRAIGRPPQSFRFRPDAAHVLAADLGGFKALVVVTDLAGTEVARVHRDLEPEWAPDRRLAALGEAADEALAAIKGKAPVSDAVVATPGTVDHDGVIVYNTVMPGWLGQNPAAWLEARLGIETTGATDIAMAALAEKWRGVAQDHDDVVYLHVGRRIGAAALIGGRPHLGAHGASPQFGLWRGQTWRPDYRDLLRLDDDGSGAPELFAAAAEGDKDARARVATFADELVAGAIPMIVAFDPELLVIGGGVSQAGEGIAGPVRERVQQETPFAPRVVVSALGADAVVEGSVRLALDHAEERVFRDAAPVGLTGTNA
jgi:predicted NBD/HSP70 family sugar kinase